MDLKNIGQDLRRGFSQTSWIIAGTIALFGILLIAIPVDFLLHLLFFVIGTITIVVSGITFFSLLSARHTKTGKIGLIITGVMCFAGFLMLFWHQNFLLIVVGIIMIAQPILAIINAPDQLVRFKKELPKLIIGSVLVFLGPANVIDSLFDIAGVILILLSIVYIIWTYRLVKKVQNKVGSRVFVDEDGNGTIDAIYVDVDEDGKADTATDYREKK